MKLEAALLEGLDPDSVYKSFIRIWHGKREGLALLHWSAYYNASECTKVVFLSESTHSGLQSPDALVLSIKSLFSKFEGSSGS